MARGSGNRDVTLTLSIETLGQEGIQALEGSVRQLAEQGGDAAPQFQVLADELQRLGAQNAALQGFKELTDQTAQLEARQQAASAAVAEMQQRLLALAEATQRASTEQNEAQATVVRTRTALTEATAALTNLRAQFQGAAKNTEEYKNKFTELLNAQSKAKIEYDAAKDALKQQNAALREAETSQSRLEGQIVKRTAAEKAATAAVEKHSAVMLQASEAAQKLGLSTENVAQAEAQLLASFNQVGSAAGGIVSEMARLADAEAEAAKAAAQLEQSLKEQFKQLLALDPEVQALNASLIESANQAAKLAREQEQLAASAAEMAEADRLLAIQERALNDLRRQGADALDAERAAIREAEQASNLYVAAKRREEQAQKEAAAAARQAAEQIDAAFRTLGTRSVAAVRQEIEQVRAAMATAAAAARSTGDSMAGAFAAGNARIKELEREIRQLSGTLTVADRAASLFKNSLGQIAAGNIIADAVGYLVNKVKELGVAFITTIAQTEQLRRGLMAIYKDTGTVASQLVFLRDTAIGAGVSVGSLQQNFVKFSAAMQSSNIPLEQSNALFSAVARAAGTLGLSGDQVTGMLEALGQMASKGTVSLEELRQQLGDRLPGALGLAANGLGITQEQLISLVSSGGLATRDFIVPFTNALKTMQGEVTGLTPAFEDLKTTLVSAAQAAGDAGWTVLLTGALRALTGVLGAVVLTLQGFTEGLFLVGKAAIAVNEALKGNLDGFRFLGEELGKTRDRLATTTKLFVNATLGIRENSEASQANAAAQQLQASAMAKTAAQADAVVESLQGAGKAAADQARANETAGLSAEQLASRYIQLSIATADQLKVTEKRIEAAEKEAKATEVMGNAIVSLTRLRGNEIESSRAAAEAAAANIAAQERVLEQRNREVALVVNQRAELQLLIQKEGDRDESRRKRLADLDAEIVKSAAAAEQSKAAVEAAKNEAVARELTTKAYEDNSAALDNFREAAAAARANVDALTKTGDESVEGQKRLVEAQRDAAMAIGLYNDALKDKIELTKSEGSAQQARYQLMNASLEVEQRSLDIQIASARAAGDFVGAVNLEIEAKGRQIEQIQNVAAAKREEAEVQLQALALEREELEAAGQLTAAKQAELAARESNAQTKIKEADASAAQVDALQREQAALRVQVDSIKAANTVEQARYNLRLSALGVEKQYLDSQAALARAAGDVEKATRLEIAAKEVQIRITALTAEAKRKEAEATIAASEAELQQLSVSGKLTEEKKAEIEARILNAKAKLEEARASGIVIEGLEAEIKKLKELRSAKDASKSGGSGGGGGSGGSGGGGFVKDGSGNTVTYGTYLPPPTRDGPWTWVPALNQGYKFGGYWRNDEGTIYTGMRGSDKPFGSQFFNYLGAPMSNLGNTLGPPPKAYEEYNAAGLTTVGPSRAPGVGSSNSTSAAPASGTPVTINIAGRKLGTVNVASRADADNLASILAGLENAKGNGA